MRIYLDNCCFNRPFDDQSSLIIRLETEAKLYVQEMIRQGQLDLVWSFMMDYENGANPFSEVKNRISEWKMLAIDDCELSKEIEDQASELMELGLHEKDAAHVACAIYLEAEYFLTTDKKILNKTTPKIKIINPIEFVRRNADA